MSPSEPSHTSRDQEAGRVEGNMHAKETPSSLEFNSGTSRRSDEKSVLDAGA